MMMVFCDEMHVSPFICDTAIYMNNMNMRAFEIGTIFRTWWRDVSRFLLLNGSHQRLEIVAAFRNDLTDDGEGNQRQEIVFGLLCK